MQCPRLTGVVLTDVIFAHGHQEVGNLVYAEPSIQLGLTMKCHLSLKAGSHQANCLGQSGSEAYTLPL